MGTKMPGHGFKSITIKEELYRKLEEIAREKNLKSIAETINFLLKNYLEKTKIEYDPRLQLALRTLGIEWSPGQPIKRKGIPILHYGRFDEPIIYATIEPDAETTDNSIIIKFVIVLNPEPFLNLKTPTSEAAISTYRRILVENLATALEPVKEEIRKIINEYKESEIIINKDLIPKRIKISEILSQFGIIIDQNIYYKIAPLR